jgi:hypothetical protein
MSACIHIALTVMVLYTNVRKYVHIAYEKGNSFVIKTEELIKS